MKRKDDLSTRMAPHSLEAEEAVLGSVLIDPESLYRVPFLAGGDFFLVKHQWIWEAMLALSTRREPIDLLTVCEELERRQQLAQVGGQAYISHLINVVPTAIHIEGYGRIVEQTSLRRKMLGAASTIAQLAYEESDDVCTQLGKAQQAILEIGLGRDGNDVEALPPLVTKYYEQVEWRYEHKGEMLGLPTGFIDLDNLLGGLRKTDMLVLAGRPGTGKTSLMLNIALNATHKFNQRVAVFSLEMSKEQIVERLVAQESGIDSQRLRAGKLDDADWPRFVEAASHLSTNGRMWIDDTPALSAMQLRSKAHRLHAQHGLDLIAVDYLQLMTADGRHENRNLEVSHLSRSLKALAKELRIPVLVVSQLSRAVEQRQDKRPQLSDLRDSGSIEQDADVVMFVYRDELYNGSAQNGTAEVIVAKHRNGPTGTVGLYFRKHLTQFANAVRREVLLV